MPVDATTVVPVPLDAISGEKRQAVEMPKTFAVGEEQNPNKMRKTGESESEVAKSMLTFAGGQVGQVVGQVGQVIGLVVGQVVGQVGQVGQVVKEAGQAPPPPPVGGAPPPPANPPPPGHPDAEMQMVAQQVQPVAVAIAPTVDAKLPSSKLQGGRQRRAKNMHNYHQRFSCKTRGKACNKETWVTGCLLTECLQLYKNERKGEFLENYCKKAPAFGNFADGKGLEFLYVCVHEKCFPSRGLVMTGFKQESSAGGSKGDDVQRVHTAFNKGPKKTINNDEGSLFEMRRHIRSYHQCGACQKALHKDTSGQLMKTNGKKASKVTRVAYNARKGTEPQHMRRDPYVHCLLDEVLTYDKSQRLHIEAGGKIRITVASTQVAVGSFDTGHTKEVQQVLSTPTRIITSSMDGTVKLFDNATHTIVASIPTTSKTGTAPFVDVVGTKHVVVVEGGVDNCHFSFYDLVEGKADPNFKPVPVGHTAQDLIVVDSSVEGRKGHLDVISVSNDTMTTLPITVVDAVAAKYEEKQAVSIA